MAQLNNSLFCFSREKKKKKSRITWEIELPLLKSGNAFLDVPKRKAKHLKWK